MVKRKKGEREKKKLFPQTQQRHQKNTTFGSCAYLERVLFEKEVRKGKRNRHD